MMDLVENDSLTQFDICKVQNALHSKQASVLAATIFQLDSVMSCIKNLLLNSVSSWSYIKPYASHISFSEYLESGVPILDSLCRN